LTSFHFGRTTCSLHLDERWSCSKQDELTQGYPYSTKNPDARKEHTGNLQHADDSDRRVGCQVMPSYSGRKQAKIPNARDYRKKRPSHYMPNMCFGFCGQSHSNLETYK